MPRLTRAEAVDLLVRIKGLQTRDLEGVVEMGQVELDRRNGEKVGKGKQAEPKEEGAEK